jgi:hypothetical protein
MTADVTLTDAERLRVLSNVPLAQGRDDDELVAAVEHVVADRLAAERERIAQAIEAIPHGRIDRTVPRAARIARGTA